MGIFDNVQKEIEAREQQDGINPADLLTLSQPMRRLMTYIIREDEVTIEAAAQRLDEPAAPTREMLNRLVEKGFLSREKREEIWFYRTRFARKRGREMPAGIWSALEQGSSKK